MNSWGTNSTQTMLKLNMLNPNSSNIVTLELLLPRHSPCTPMLCWWTRLSTWQDLESPRGQTSDLQSRQWESFETGWIKTHPNCGQQLLCELESRTEWKGESKASTRIHRSLLLMAPAVWPHSFPHHGGLYSQTVGQRKPFLSSSAFLRYCATSKRKVNN